VRASLVGLVVVVGTHFIFVNCQCTVNSQMVVFILDKMDMKKLIRDFRHLQRERQKAKLIKNKMANFNVLMFRRRGADQVLLDEQAEVTIRLHQGVNLAFLNRNGQGFFVLYDADIEGFDDGEPDIDEDNEQPTLTATLTIYREAQSVILEFGTLLEKRSFITSLNEFLELR
jgi:hypothetical protein